MNGIICINKPQDFTSFDVIAVARKVLNTRKIGHGGTLDPLAVGVLPLFVGNATKAVDFCPNTDKEYIAGFKFGLTTDTEDITGKILTEKDEYVSRNKVALFERIKGELEQTPPMYSAVKVNGTRLYDFARRGEEVPRKSRSITVYSVKVLDYRDNEGLIKVHCSKGTYIRTLIHDFGQKLGVGAVMTSLQRTMSSGFTLEDCVTLDQLSEIKLGGGISAIQDAMLAIEDLFSVYPKAYLNAVQTRMFSNGVTLQADKIRFDKIYEGIYSIYDCNQNFGAIGRISSDHSLQILQRFQQPDIKLAKGVKKNLNID